MAPPPAIVSCMPDARTDFELLGLYARDGSNDAFAALVERHVSWVRSSARRQVRDPGTADDVTQAAFILLARKPPKLRPEQSLAPWLLGVVRNTAMTALRAQARRRRHEGKF